MSSNVLAQELLTDVHRICTANAETQDFTELGEYLLKGRGAALLSQLNRTKLQGLSCIKELTELSLHLLSMCFHLPCNESKLQGKPVAPITACFESPEPVISPRKKSKFPTLSEVGRPWPTSQPVPEADSDTEEETQKQTSSRHSSHSHRPGSPTPHQPFEVNYLLQHAKDHLQAATSDFGPESYSSVVDLEDVVLTAPELCVVLLSLLRMFAMEGRWMNVSSESSAATIIPMLIGLLESMYAGEDGIVANKPEWGTGEELNYVQLYIVRLLISLGALVTRTNDGVAFLESERIVPRLLNIAVRLDSMTAASESTDVQKQLCSDIIHGLWMLVCYVFTSVANNPLVIKHSVKVFHQLAAESKLAHTQMTDALLDTFADVAVAIQQTKINYMHSLKCKRRHHNKCDFSHFGHHHNDLVGVASTVCRNTEELLTNAEHLEEAPLPCCLASLAEIILTVIEENSAKLARSKLLNALHRSGVCCCISRARLLSVLLGLAPHSLPLLISIVINQCGAGSEERTCDLCGISRTGGMGPSTVKEHGHHHGFTSDSAFSSSENSLHDLTGSGGATASVGGGGGGGAGGRSGGGGGNSRSSSPSSRWRSLSQFLPHITKNDYCSMAILQHVFILAECANQAVEQELFQRVFLPLLLDCTHESIKDYTLSGLPILLQSPGIYHAFMQSQGLDFVMSCPLSQMLAILQVLILLSQKDDRAAKLFQEMLTIKTEAALALASTSTSASSASQDDDNNNIEELWMTAHTLHHHSATFQKLFTCSELARRVVHDGLMRQRVNEGGAHAHQQTMNHAWTSALAIYIQHHKTLKKENKPKRLLEELYEQAGLPLCERLLTAAMAPNAPQHHRAIQLPLVLDQDYDSLWNEGSTRDSSESAPSHKEADEGYEADTELEDIFHSHNASLCMSRGCHVHRHVSTELVHPELMALVLRVQLKYGACDDRIMTRLIQAAKQGSGASLLHAQGVQSLILDGFQAQLSTPCMENKEQRCNLLLSLFTEIAKDDLSDSELRKFLQLFDGDKPPVGSLLRALSSLVKDEQPAHTLSFPVISRGGGGGSENPPSPLTPLSHPSEVASLGLPIAEESGRITNSSGFYVALWLNISSGNVVRGGGGGVHRAESPLHSPALLPSPSSPRPRTGSTLSQQQRHHPLQHQKQEKYHHWSPSCLHIVSLGNRAQTTQVWLDVANSCLIIRLQTGDSSVEESSIPCHLSADRWQHLTVAAKPKDDKIKVTCGFNGLHHKEVFLPNKAAGTTQPQQQPLGGTDEKCRLLLGHYTTATSSSSSSSLSLSTQSTQPNGSWRLGNVWLFKDYPGTWSSFWLYQRGPLEESLSHCDCGEREPRYCTWMNPEALLAQQDAKTDPSELLNLLCLSYNPRSPAHYSWFPACTNPLQQKPQLLSIETQSPISPHIHTGLSTALDSVGGVDVLLYLAAKVMELDGVSEQEQALAVGLLLRVSISSSRHHLHHDMLAKVLTSTKTIIGFPMLKVVLDACTTHSIVEYRSSRNQYFLSTLPTLSSTYPSEVNTNRSPTPPPPPTPNTNIVNPSNRLSTPPPGSPALPNTTTNRTPLSSFSLSTSLFHNHHVLGYLVLSWRIWQRADPGVWEMLMRGVASLVAPSHPHREFNIKQLKEAGTVARLLRMCMERPQESYHLIPLPVELCDPVLAIISAVIGSPPDLLTLITVWDFLVLAHPAARTFVVHNLHDFYMAHKWPVHRPTVHRPGAARQPHSLSRTPSAAKTTTTASSGRGSPTSGDSSPHPGSSSSSRSTTPPPFGSGIGNEALERIDSKKSTESTATWKSNESSFAGFDSHKIMSIDEESSLSSTYQGSLSSDLHSLPLTSSTNTGESTTAGSQQSSVLKGRIPRRAGARADPYDGEVDKVTKVWDVTQDEQLLKKISQTASIPIFSSDENKPDREAAEDSDGGGIVVVAVEKTDGGDGGTGKIDRVGAGTSHSSESETTSTETSSKLLSAKLTAAQKGASYSVSDDIPEENDAEKGEEGLVNLSIGLLQKLTQMLPRLTTDEKSQFLGPVVSPEALIVMAYHSSDELRAEVVRLVGAYLSCASPTLKEVFMKHQYHQLLANQLHQSPSTQVVVDACMEVLLNGSTINSVAEQDICGQRYIILLLGLLQKSVPDLALCHNLLTTINEVFMSSAMLTSVFTDNGILEVLCNVIYVLNTMPPTTTDLGVDERDLLWADISSLISNVMERYFRLHGGENILALEDTMLLLRMLESMLRRTYGAASVQVQNLRSIQCAGLQNILDFVADLVNSTSQQPESQLKLRHNPATGSPHFSRLKSALPSSSLINTSLLLLTSPSQASSTSKPSSTVWSAPRPRTSLASNPKTIFNNLLSRKSLEATQTELMDRARKLLTIATEFAMYAAYIEHEKTPAESHLENLVQKEAAQDIEVVSHDRMFARLLLEFLVKAMVIALDRNFLRGRGLFLGRDVVRIELGRLLIYFVSPQSPLPSRLFAVELLVAEARHEDIIKTLCKTEGLGDRMALHLHELLTSHWKSLSKVQRDEVDELLGVLERLFVAVYRLGSKLTSEEQHIVDEDRMATQITYKKHRARWLERRDNARPRVLRKMREVKKDVSVRAMDSTQQVTQLQNTQRKHFLEHVKKQMTHRVNTKRSWYQLIQQLSHERSVMAAPYQPDDWQMDPTEGPSRVRKRLQRYHCDLHQSFFMADRKHKTREGRMMAKLEQGDSTEQEGKDEGGNRSGAQSREHSPVRSPIRSRQSPNQIPQSPVREPSPVRSPIRSTQSPIQSPQSPVRSSQSPQSEKRSRETSPAERSSPVQSPPSPVALSSSPSPPSSRKRQSPSTAQQQEPQPLSQDTTSSPINKSPVQSTSPQSTTTQAGRKSPQQALDTTSPLVNKSPVSQSPMQPPAQPPVQPLPTREAWKSSQQPLETSPQQQYVKPTATKPPKTFPTAKKAKPAGGCSSSRGKPEPSLPPPCPLEYLFEAEDSEADSQALIYKLHTSQNIAFNCDCVNVTPSAETCGVVLIGERDVYFVADKAISLNDHTELLLGNRDRLFLTLPHQDIVEIHRRWFRLKDLALELFLSNGTTCLLACKSTKERDALGEVLHERDLPCLVRTENTSVSGLQEQWLRGRLTNFDYLTQINKLAGRSFNDLMQYPVFPYVLRDYTSNTLDLHSRHIYRHFKKPIGIQNPECKARARNKYETTRIQLEVQRDDFELLIAPFHYGTHYSNAATVMKYLMRIPPYTEEFIIFQSHKFDTADRLFHRMIVNWGDGNIQPDVKELIPELFFLPELFQNINGFDMGVCQNGERVDDVIMPPWSGQDARRFVHIHRAALESDFVTRHLPHWIDLVFGAKQQGKAAVDAMNAFHPCTYYGLNISKIDPLSQEAVKNMIKMYGQTPKQLFFEAHPIPQKGYKPKPTNQILAVPTVSGLRWGPMVWSPDLPPPREPVWRYQYPACRIANITPFSTGEVLGVGTKCHVMVQYSRQNGSSGASGPPASSGASAASGGAGPEYPSILWLCIVSWGYPDNVIRVEMRGSEPVNFIRTRTEVSCCASAPDSRLMLFGYENGVISAQHIKYNHAKASKLQVFGIAVQLYGHTAAVTALCVSRAFHLVVSASRDTTLIIWDLNKLSYVRSIREHTSSVKLLCVSETSGDIVSVSHLTDANNESGSVVYLHSINGALAGRAKTTEYVQCICMSTLPEGRCINVVAAGLRSGTVRLWSSWDLLHLRDITYPFSTAPVLSLSFSCDHQRLFVSDAEGIVLCWQTEGSHHIGSRDVNFIPHLNTSYSVRPSSLLSHI